MHKNVLACSYALLYYVIVSCPTNFASRVLSRHEYRHWQVWCTVWPPSIIHTLDHGTRPCSHSYAKEEPNCDMVQERFLTLRKTRQFFRATGATALQVLIYIILASPPPTVLVCIICSCLATCQKISAVSQDFNLSRGGTKWTQIFFFGGGGNGIARYSAPSRGVWGHVPPDVF